MKKHLQFITSTKQLPIIAVILLFFVMSVSVQAQMPIAGNDALRCGAGELTLTVSWSGAPLNPDNVKWYTQPFYGTPIATGLSYTTPYLEFTVPYYVDYIGDEGCSQCDRLLIRAVIADQVITPQVLYSSVTFCNSVDHNFVPTIVGASGGSFSVSPVLGAGSFNTATGAFNPSGLQTGVYVVTFNPTEIIGCNSNAVTVNLSVNTAPVQPVISYQFDSYCSSSEAAAVTQSGATGGSYSASPSGLSINSMSGLITPAASQTGNYTVTYLVPGGGGCPPVSTTTEVSIMQLPVITTFNYNSPFCGTISAQLPNLEVQHDYTPGAEPYSYTGSGTLALNPVTGAIDPSNSDAGAYTITYTIPAATPCGSVAESTSVIIYPVSAATVAADKTQEFKDRTNPVITFTGSVGPAPYLFTYRIDIGEGNDLVEGLPTTISTANDQTATTTVEQSTEVEGVFTYVLLAVTDANGCEVLISGQSVSISILGIPDTDFVYAGSPYCTSGGYATPTGSTAGTFSYVGNGLSLNTETGVVTLATSTAGTYMVTHTLNGYSSSAEIVITRLPVAIFGYAQASYCPTAGNVAPNVTNDIGVFTANDPAVIFADGNGVAPGTIDAIFTPPGTYTITNTIQAGNGCVEVSYSTEITIAAAPNYTANRAYEICSGSETNIIHTADIPGSTFSWTISGVTGSITGQSAGSGGTIQQTLTNPSNTETGTVSYMVTPSHEDNCGAGVPTVVVVTVYPRPATPTAGNLTVTYDGEVHIATATSSTMTQGSEAAVIDWYDAETGGDATTAPTGTTVGTYTAWAEARYASTGCVSASRTEVTLTIEQKTLTVVDAQVTARDYDGSTLAAITGATISGVESGDVVNLDNHTSGTFAQKDVGIGISVTTAMTLTGANAGNYTLTQPILTGNISQKALSAASTIADKNYDGSSVAGNVSLGEISGYVGSETLVITPTASNYADANVANGKSTTISYALANGENGGLATNYSMADLTTTGNILPVTITVTADDIIRGVSETTPAYTYTMSGFVNGETEQGLRDGSALSGAVTFTDNTEGSTASGTYTITPVITSLTATNYVFSAINGTLTIVEVVVEATGGEARAGYNTLAAAYNAINAGTHTGEITIHIYANTTETSTATLNTSGTGDASYSSVSIIPHNNVTISGSASPLMILGN